MRKVAYIIIPVVVILIAWLFFKEDVKLRGKVKTQEKAQLESVEQTDKLNKNVDSSLPVETKAEEFIGTEIVTEKDSASCHKRYQEHENWQKISDIYADIYMTESEIIGNSTFQTMPLEAVKAYADVGDRDAMFHYGLELLWKGGMGTYFNPLNQTPGISSEERRKIIKKSQPDFKVLEQGTDYLFKSALQGKYGGLIEIDMMLYFSLKRAVREDVDKEKVQKLAVKYIAYNELFKRVFFKDPGIVSSFSSYEEKAQELLSKEFGNKELAKQLEQIQLDGKLQGKELIEQWEIQRRTLNQNVFVDALPDYLDQHIINKMKECDTQ